MDAVNLMVHLFAGSGLLTLLWLLLQAQSHTRFVRWCIRGRGAKLRQVEPVSLFVVRFARGFGIPVAGFPWWTREPSIIIEGLVLLELYEQYGICEIRYIQVGRYAVRLQKPVTDWAMWKKRMKESLHCEWEVL